MNGLDLSELFNINHASSTLESIAGLCHDKADVIERLNPGSDHDVKAWRDLGMAVSMAAFEASRLEGRYPIE
jgi:hypothetical protein